MTTGYVNSIETMATLDGPGLRTVIFLQGCPLACNYCHNVDLQRKELGEKRSVADIIKEVSKYRNYWEKSPQSKGGVTISGGEPTYQPEFLIELCKELSANNIHVALDTCLFTDQSVIIQLLPYVNLWMVSYKHPDPEQHRRITGVRNEKIQANIYYLDEELTKLNQHKQNQNNQKSLPQMRLRFVLIPGLTDNVDIVGKVAVFAAEIKNLEVIEILPYSSIGREKWIKIFGRYDLEEVPEAEITDVKKAAAIFMEKGLKVKY